MTRRLAALVIGNADYASITKLSNPTNDADDIALHLEAAGFKVIKMTNCTTEQMARALNEFQEELVGKEVGLFFFAGHGLQINGENYLAGINANMHDEPSAKFSSLPLNQVIEVIEQAEVDTSIIILDACRDNPFERRWSRSATMRGLAPVYAPKGTLIAFATSPGQIACDGPGNRNGRYSEALLRHIDTPDVSIETMFKRVRNTLSTATKGKQISWEHTSLSGEFFFNLSVGARVDIYSTTSISDSLFVLDESRYSHRLIRSLRCYNWPAQNSALAEFSAAKADKCRANSLFVVGRNIYQAACGSSHESTAYIAGFMTRTIGMADEKRKALLDGMLFEVFFDKRGELRDTPKSNRFAELFALQQHKELSDSFEFIAECLLPYSSRFYAIPGKSHQLPVDVVLRSDGTQQQVKEVTVAGRDVLRPEDDDSIDEKGNPIKHISLSQEKFRALLVEELIVADHLLKVTFNTSLARGALLQVPRGYTVAKLQPTTS